MGNLLHKFKREIMFIGPFRRLIFKLLEKKLYRAVVEKGDAEDRVPFHRNFFLSILIT